MRNQRNYLRPQNVPLVQRRDDRKAVWTHASSMCPTARLHERLRHLDHAHVAIGPVLPRPVALPARYPRVRLRATCGTPLPANGCPHFHRAQRRNGHTSRADNCLALPLLLQNHGRPSRPCGGTFHNAVGRCGRRRFTAPRATVCEPFGGQTSAKHLCDGRPDASVPDRGVHVQTLMQERE